MKVLKLLFVMVAVTLFGWNFVSRSEFVKAAPAVNVPSAPTGVKATDNVYSTKVGVYWDAIRSATLYRILRNTTNSPTGATEVGSTVANSFYDSSAVAGTQYYYFVTAENSAGSSAASVGDAGLRGVGTVQPGAIGTLEPPVAPSGNPVTAAKVFLGKTLFWDEQLSSNNTVACGTCHVLGTGGSDPRSQNAATSVNPGNDGVFGNADDKIGSRGVSAINAAGEYLGNASFGFGVQVGGRKANPVLNAAYSQTNFWDGRASEVFRDPITNAVVLDGDGALESQAVGPPLNNIEMAHNGRSWNDIVPKMTSARPLALASNVPAGLSTWIGGRTYPQLFEEAFGTTEISPVKIALAIATYERTLFTDQTPLDRKMHGLETLTAEEDAGMQIFLTLQCNSCHEGPNFANNQFHNIGVRPQSDDAGRNAVTGATADLGAFRVPGLRNTELRAPYMHTGKFETVESVVEFYDRGGDFDAPNIDHGLITPLHLTATDKANLAAFLKRPLTDPRVAQGTAPFDRPTLFAETTRVPTVTGTGRAGTGAVVPEVVATEPPFAGNQRFAINVNSAAPNANAVLVINNVDPGVGTTIPSTGAFARVQKTTSAGGFATAVVSIPNLRALIGKTFYARWYVTDGGAASGFSVSKLITFTVFGNTLQSVNSPFDFDADGKTDVSIYRPSNGQWWLNRSTAGVTAATFGTTGDKLTPADFTGDGKTDIAFFRPSNGNWFVLRSEDSTYYAYPFGMAGDIPTTGDFDADGKSDTVVFRVGTWFILRSSGGVDVLGFGADGDIPVVADYDGDYMSDLAIYRPANGQWWLLRSTAGVTAYQFGDPNDKPTAGDYTGDGKADVAFYRRSTGFWYILRSEDTSYYGFPFGSSEDIPAAGDYDGDGKFDAAVFRPSTGVWYATLSHSGVMIQSFGANGDTPVPSSYIP